MTTTDAELKELSERKRKALEVAAKLTKTDRIDVPTLTAVGVNKMCRTCGYKWHGKFFREWVVKAHKKEFDGKQYIMAYCDSCTDKWERADQRMQLECNLDIIDAQLRDGPPKAKKVRMMRAKSKMLVRIRDLTDPGGTKWADLTDRIQTLNDAIVKLDK